MKYEMICITKRCVTFNKYARNFNFHNEMKATVTLSHSHAALYLPQLHETPGMHIYKMKSVTRKRCRLRYTYTRNCGSTKEIKLTPHKRRISHDKFSTQICSHMDQCKHESLKLNTQYTTTKYVSEITLRANRPVCASTKIISINTSL